MAAEVAFVIPIAPRSPWLSQTLQSVVSQDLESWECVAVLDGDSEENRAVLEQHVPGDRLRIVTLSPGSGVARALNAGMAATSAEFVARLDADDVAEPDRLSRQIPEMRARQDLWVLGSAALDIDPSGSPVQAREVPVGAPAVRRQMVWHNVVVHPSVVLRREPVVRIGGYNHSSTRAEDYELWLRVLAHADIDNLPERLLRYRVHPDQHSRGPALGSSSIIRRARHQSARSAGEHLIAEVAHLTWWTYHAARQGRRAFGQ